MQIFNYLLDKKLFFIYSFAFDNYLYKVIFYKLYF